MQSNPTPRRRKRKVRRLSFIKFLLVKTPILWIIAFGIAWFTAPKTVNNTTTIGTQNNYNFSSKLALPARTSLEELAEKTATEYQIDPLLFRALITQESQWNPTIVSTAGAVGLGQVMPFNASLCGIEKEDLIKPEVNLPCSARILLQALTYWSGDIDHALGEYNAGRNAVISRNALVDFKETRLYVARIKCIVAGMQQPTLCSSRDCLRLKEGATAGGESLPELFELAQAIQSNIPGIIWFSGFNDGYKPRKEKGHEEGRAMDLTIVDKDDKERVIQAIRQLAPTVRIVDEYVRTKGTGGHLHVELL